MEYSRSRFDSIPTGTTYLCQSHIRHDLPLSTNSTIPPIPMPASNSNWNDHHHHQLNSQSGKNSFEITGGGLAGNRSLYMKSLLLPIEQDSRGRRPSVTFNSSVRIEGDRELSLQAPLSKTNKPRLFRIMTDVEHCAYESDFRGLGEGDVSGGYSSSLQSSRFGRSGLLREGKRVTAAHKFLMCSKSPSLAGDEEEEDGAIDSVESLTSGSTMSPMSEFHTPNSMGSLFSQKYMQSSSMSGIGGLGGSDSACDVGGRGICGDGSLSVGDTTFPWRPRRRENITFPRNKSLTFDRSRSRPRTSRRAVSERSFNSYSSGGVSPASMFLSSFGKKSPSLPQMVEPDSEGQEVGNYVLGKEIARGGFSTVKEAFTIDGNGVELKRAVKIVRKRVYPDNEAENDSVQASFDHEVSLWRYLHHANIIPLLSVFDTPFATFAFMKLNTDGSLFDLMKRPENRQGLSAQRAQRYCYQVACALWYLHRDMRIVHGDIKLENCLVDLTQDSAAGGNILLCDFGLARFIKYADDNENAAGLPKQQQQSQLSDKFCLTGSLQYAAPEIIQATHQDESSSPAVDIWAFAVTVYTLHTGSLPFNHSLQPKLASMILNGTWDVDRLRNCWGLAKAGKTETENVVQVVKGGLCKNTSRRWNIGDVLDSAWLENYG